MYTIGQISKMVNITPNALRYYDEISLLKPSQQDLFSGYRYYNDEQIKELVFIQELKYYGFSLKEIKGLLGQDENILRLALEKKLKKLQRTFEEDRTRLKMIQRKIADSGTTDKRILLVEDVAFERMLLKEILISHGFSNIVECSNGQELVEKYEEVCPQLVITGITMPIMDGLYAMSLIRQKHKGARAIFCSYMSQIYILPVALRTKACFDFIPKPLDVKRLLSSVVRGLEASAEISLQNQMDKELIHMIEQDIAADKRGQDYQLNQSEVDTFFEMKSMKEYYELKERIIRNQEISEEDKYTRDTIDFEVMEIHLAIQREVNRQLLNLIDQNEMKNYVVDFVYPQVIQDNILGHNFRSMMLWSGETCIGGIFFEPQMEPKLDKFISCLMRLEAKIIKGLKCGVTQHSPALDLQTEYILSTFMDQEDYKLLLLIQNNSYN